MVGEDYGNIPHDGVPIVQVSFHLWPFLFDSHPSQQQSWLEHGNKGDFQWMEYHMLRSEWNTVDRESRTEDIP